MNCEDIEGLIPAYVLNALDPDEVLEVERHLDGCPWCSIKVKEQLEVAANLALAAEPSRPSPRVLQGILDIVNPPPVRSEPPRRPVPALRALAFAAASVAVLLLGGVLAFSFRTSGKMDDLSDTNLAMTERITELQEDNVALSQELTQLRRGNDQVAQQMTELNKGTLLVAKVAEEVDRLREGSSEAVELIQLSLGSTQDLSQRIESLTEMLVTQRSIIYMFTQPGTKVLNLSTSGDFSRSQGSLMFNTKNSSSVFVGSSLKTLAPDRAYYIWLKKGDSPYQNLGSLDVDKMGWGIAILHPRVSMEEDNWIRVTVEDVTKGPVFVPSEPVMWGSLHGADPMRP